MALSNKYTIAFSRIPDFFSKIRDGQAPEQLTRQLIKDWGFTSSNDHAFVPLLKELGFLSPDGKPTSRYNDYRDHSRSKSVMAQALREAYSDIFLIKEHPTEGDKEAIKGKFKSFHNASDNVANLMMKNFYELLKLSDLKATPKKEKPATKPEKEAEANESLSAEKNGRGKTPEIHAPGLHYNIQIHLPASKDIEVYNAIFKSLREHIIEK
ncbi:MAG: DUF5343 domain-containing protein [Sneathiella sp.]